MPKALDIKGIPGVAERVVRWQKSHGRNSLPWQNTVDPYRVWLSEIMLQQTQVATVRDYFERFTRRLPTVADLAQASADEVMGLWSGLGYYSRARNLHRCAQIVMQQHGGQFPRQAELLQTLPGIGRSTAAAIASLCFGERVAILDANVKRVLTRLLAFEGDLAQARQEHALWALAQELVPGENTDAKAMARYTQGMMDLGATVCLARKPLCGQCPLQSDCLAHAKGCVEEFPVRTRKLKRSNQSMWLVWAQDAHGAVWLQRRPAPGVWAGLHCLPVFDSETELRNALPAMAHKTLQPMAAFVHVLTHKDLHIHPFYVRLAAGRRLSAMEGGWVAAKDWPTLGLPAPVRKLLETSALA
jgi:A/G-specific adenine glycosylase